MDEFADNFEFAFAKQKDEEREALRKAESLTKEAYKNYYWKKAVRFPVHDCVGKELRIRWNYDNNDKLDFDIPSWYDKAPGIILASKNRSLFLAILAGRVDEDESAHLFLENFEMVLHKDQVSDIMHHLVERPIPEGLRTMLYALRRKSDPIIPLDEEKGRIVSKFSELEEIVQTAIDGKIPYKIPEERNFKKDLSYPDKEGRDTTAILEEDVARLREVANAVGRELQMAKDKAAFAQREASRIQRKLDSANDENRDLKRSIRERDQEITRLRERGAQPQESTNGQERADNPVDLAFRLMGISKEIFINLPKEQQRQLVLKARGGIAMFLHPDRTNGLPEEVRREQQEALKRRNNAFDRLEDSYGLKGK